jgi:RNA polymerase sigma-70 factor (ECF subfamily)
MYDGNMPQYNDYNKMTDVDLIKSSLAKDQTAFKYLVERYIDRIYSFSKSFNLSDDEAEDIAQETFFKAWKKLHLYNDKHKFQTWIFTIAKNSIFDYLRKKKSLPFSYFDNNEDQINPLDQITDSDDDAIEIFQNNTNIAKVRESLVKLNTIERSIITLHYEEELTFEEIGTIMDKPMNTVKSLHRRSISKLKSLINAPKTKFNRITNTG